MTTIRYSFSLVFLSVVAVVLTLSVSDAMAARLLVLTEHSPPLSYEQNGRLLGVSTDIFLEMCRRSEIDVTRKDIRIWPWARSYDEALHSPDVVLYSMARTMEREALFQWVGPIMDVRCTVVARKRTKMEIDDIRQSVIDYRIGTVPKSAPELRLIEMGVGTGQLHRVHDMKLNVKKLAEGRIDALIFNEPAIFHTIKGLGLDPDDYEVVKTIMEFPLYYAISRDTNPELVNKLQESLDLMKAEGGIKQIRARYE